MTSLGPKGAMPADALTPACSSDVYYMSKFRDQLAHAVIARLHEWQDDMDELRALVAVVQSLEASSHQRGTPWTAYPSACTRLPRRALADRRGAGTNARSAVG